MFSANGSALTTILLYVATVLVWGSTWIMMKFQLGVVAPAASLTYRYFLAGCSRAGRCLAGRQSGAAWPSASIYGAPCRGRSCSRSTTG